VDVELSLAGGTVRLPGNLERAERAEGLVIFVHGSGSSRLSPRNRMVAATLRGAGCATLLFDLLTGDEAQDRANVFDVPLLGSRVAGAIDWVRAQPAAGTLPIGLFGASTGTAAALVAAAERPDVAAVVSRGGRPDLARDRLGEVRSPTLLIVGGADTEVLALNRSAFAALRCRKSLEIVPGATHLFEEPGTLDTVVRLAGGWFLDAFAAAEA